MGSSSLEMSISKYRINDHSRIQKIAERIHQQLEKRLNAQRLDDLFQNQLPNNIREIALIVLQFRAEIGSDVNLTDMKEYEHSIVEYFQKWVAYSRLQLNLQQ